MPSVKDHPWIAVVHAPEDAGKPVRVSLHLRRDGRNYHIGMRMPPDVLRVVQQKADQLTARLNQHGIIAGQEFQGQDRLLFPDDRDEFDQKLAEARAGKVH